MKKIMITLLILLLISSISAFEIRPEKTELNFEPNLKKTINFSIINTKNKDMNIIISVQGELKDYIKINQNSVSIKSDEYLKELSYNILLPETLSPELHNAEIIAMQVPSSSSSSDSSERAALAAVTLLHISNNPSEEKQKKDTNQINLILAIAIGLFLIIGTNLFWFILLKRTKSKLTKK